MSGFWYLSKISTKFLQHQAYNNRKSSMKEEEKNVSTKVHMRWAEQNGKININSENKAKMEVHKSFLFARKELTMKVEDLKIFPAIPL